MDQRISMNVDSMIRCGLALGMILLTQACGDSGSSSSGGTGGTGAGATGGTGGTSGTGGGGGTGAGSCIEVHEEDKVPGASGEVTMYTCDENPSTQYPESPNSCRNTGDCELIATNRVREIVRTCALGCRDDAAPCATLMACNDKCIQDTTVIQLGSALSSPCGKCYTEISLCSLEFCLSECIASADAPECIICQFAAGCRVGFERCSGLDRSE